MTASGSRAAPDGHAVAAIGSRAAGATPAVASIGSRAAAEACIAGGTSEPLRCSTSDGLHVISVVTGVQAIAAVVGFTCALMQTGGVRCWGDWVQRSFIAGARGEFHVCAMCSVVAHLHPVYPGLLLLGF